MQKTVDRLKEQQLAQIDNLLGLCQIGFGCCTQLSQIQSEAIRDCLAQASAHRDELLRGDVMGFGAGASGIAATHWRAWLACATDFQKQWLADLQKSVPAK